MRRTIFYPGLTAFFLLIFFVPAAYATWNLGGVPVGPYPEPQPENLQTIADGSGGSIVTWQGHRGAGEFVFAQRIDAEGNTHWEPGGVILCPGMGSQYNLQIIADGTNGAIVVWDAYHEGSWKIYAQRVDASGAIQWNPNGVPVCTVGVIMSTFQLSADEAGGAIVTWRDFRNGSNDIYAQRVDASGADQWTPNGIPVCLEPTNKVNLQATSDGTGGAIIAWESASSEGNNFYVQRIDLLGAPQWNLAGVPISESSPLQMEPRIVNDGSGGAIIAWLKHNGFSRDIITQRINASGLVQWAGGGVPFGAVIGIERKFQIIPDGEGGMIGAWSDVRGDFSYSEVFVQRVDATGTVQWTAGGVQTSTASHNQYDPQLTSDGAGGAIVTWEDRWNTISGSDIIGQRVDASGILQWTADGVTLVSALEDQKVPQITFNGSGGAIVAWLDQRNGSDEIYAQQMDSFGALQWADNGEPVCVATGAQVANKIISDGAGGSIVTWYDQRTGNNSIYSQRIDAYGTTLWPADGVPLLTSTWDVGLVSITSDGEGGGIFSWQDNRNGVFNIYAQRVDASGTVQWATNGIPLHVQLTPQVGSQVVSDGVGGAIVTWADGRNGFGDIYAQRLNASGTMSWISDGVPVCQAPHDQSLPQVIADGNGGAIVSWDDFRNGYAKDIYAQRINASGAVLWVADGVPICTALEWQQYSRITSDGAGGAIVTWLDNRNGIFNIYAQNINASGTVQWTTDGVPLCLASGGQGGSRITSDGAGGAIVTWFDWRNDSSDIYTQRISALGIVQWTPDGVPICTATGEQDNPEIITDGSGGAIITWPDFRGDDYDVFAQRVSASGTALWTPDGIPVCAATGHQLVPRITSDDAGGAIATWGDSRWGSIQIYAQRITGDGLGPICALDPDVLEIPGIVEIGAYSDTTFTISNFGTGELNGFVEEACANFEIISGVGAFVLGSGQSHQVTIRFEPTAHGAHQCVIETGLSLCSTVTVIGTAPGGETEVPAGLPTQYLLYSCVPNPFNPHTMIRYDLPEAAQVSLHIYDIAGRLVRTLASGELVAQGRHELVWLGRNDAGRQVAAGVYFYRFVAGSFEQTRRMVLIK